MATVPLAACPDGVDENDWAVACAAVRSFCGWHVAPSLTEPVTVDGPGGDTLLLPTLHLTNLTDVTNDGAPVANPEWSATGMVRGSWTSKFRGVVATMTHGHSACPPELLAVVKAFAHRLVFDRAAASGAQVSQVGQIKYVLPTDTTGEASTEWSGPAHEVAVLDRYRIPARP